jgi:L-malate glycosyltransferase
MAESREARPERIRIAYILPTEVRGGVEEHVLSLVKEIDKRKFQVFIVAPAILLQSLQQDFEQSDAEVLPLQISGLFDWQEMIRFYRFLKKYRIHLVNTHMFIATFYYAPLARLAGVPVVLETTHLMEKWRLGKGFFHRNSFLVDRAFYLLLDKALAVSHACKRDLVRMKGISPDKVVVIQNGRDLANFCPVNINRRAELRKTYNFTSNNFIFGVFARLNHQKGHKYLLTAVKILKDRGISVTVIFVGDGELKESLVSQCHELEIVDQVVFAGFQKYMPGYYSMIDVMVLPSLYEGLPLCVIEALAMEKPTIATEVDGTPELVIPGKTGLLIKAEDPQGLADAMAYALDNREIMHQMGRNGRSFVLESFSIQRQVRETETLYEKLCCNKGVFV